MCFDFFTICTSTSSLACIVNTLFTLLGHIKRGVLHFRDSRRCMRYVAFLKQENHMLFIGDSRIRQIFLAMVNQVSQIIILLIDKSVSILICYSYILVNSGTNSCLYYYKHCNSFVSERRVHVLKYF